ncbi:rod shape-determining protein MreC [Alkalibacillus salilacus]|uniref:Cell shape-determining protein MreC n=1 Tax=Alkalibacillus salilacus TaxID=284582 RepID=A0ABT9VCT8_9BACI|nr:rod shape-determining protein MreC [Alkalibacillus salilacus]MDQ0158759.1 rod shape-determining protein MreC [Alkalibacillus salilacus]
MPSFLRKRKLIVFLLSIIIIVSLIGYSLRSDGSSSVPAQFAHDTVGLFQSVLHKPIGAIADFTGSVSDMRQVYEQNQVLKQELQDYKSLAYEVNELEKENEELRAMADVDTTLSDYETLNATVIARSSERWFQQVTINKGSQHGVQENMAVQTAKGMVGKVINASQLTSTVQLLSGFGAEHQVSAIVDQNENIFGMIEGYDSENDQLIFRDLSDDSELEEGQAVVTSGLGGVFPRGILIGEISSIELDQYGLTSIAHVEPAADLNDINQVKVVDRELQTVEPSEEDEES